MANTNVQFKRGLSTDLPQKNNAVDGAFYLTTDTNRLYVGNGTNLSEINRYIVTVESKENLPSQASIEDFVYIKEGNIFAVCTGKDANGNAQWTQINSVEVEQGLSTDTYVSNASITEQDGTYTLSLEITSKNAQGSITSLTPVTTTFTIPVINVGLAAENITEGGAKLKITGTGSNDNDTINLIGAGGVSIACSEDGKTITASGKTYFPALENTSIKLKDNTGSFVDDAIEVIGDEDWIEVTNSNNKLKIAHKTKSITSPEAGKTTLSNGTTFNAITGMIVDDNNHITGYTTTQFTAQDTTYTIVGSTNENKIKIDLKDQSGSIKSTAEVDITHNITIDDKIYTVKPGDALPAIYSKSMLDSKFKGINAMTYKGVISSPEQMLAITEGELGDTYKVSQNFTVTYNDSQTYSLYIGDLLIVNGDENDEGKVTNIQWDQIEAGERLDTTYTLSAADNSIVLTASTGNTNTLTLSDDDTIILSGANDIIEAKHKQQTIVKSEDTQAPVQGDTFTAITQILDDGYGHIKEYETTTYTLPGEDKITIDTENKKLEFKNAQDGLQGSLQFVAGTDILVSGEKIDTDSNSLKTTIEHNTITRTDPTETKQTVAYSGSFDIIESISTSSTGHVTGVQVKEITLPAEVTYNLQDVDIKNNIATWNFANNSGATLGSVKIGSTSLNITKDTNDDSNDAIKIEMNWGSF